MDSLKKHGDPLDEEIRRDPARGVEEVASKPDNDATMEPTGDLGRKRTNM